MEGQLEARLVIIQVDGTSANLPPKDNDVILAAVRQVRFLLDVVEVAGAGVRRLRGQCIQP
jgi:hypothetical protein